MLNALLMLVAVAVLLCCTDVLVWLSSRKRDKEASAPAPVTHDVGRAHVTLFLKDGTTQGPLTFDGEWISVCEFSHAIDAEEIVERWRRRAGKTGFFSLGNGEYVNIDQVKGMNVSVKSLRVTEDNEEA